MRQFLCQDNGFKECEAWCPHCWVNIENPDMNDINFLLGYLHMPTAFIESITDIDERPHMDREGDWRLTILRIPVRLSPTDEMPYGTVPISIITNNEIIVTVCSRRTELIPDFISHTNARNILIDTEPDFVLRILYSSAFWYLKYLREISDDVLHDDKRLERSIRNEDLKNMMKLQRTLVFFNTSLQGNNTVVGRLEHVYGNGFDADLLEDVEIELKQADNTANIYSNILSSSMDSFSSIISNNVNAIMKKMTAVSIVLMVPTLIASFYGMNVEITYGNHPYVFWLILGGSLLLSSILYVVLKKIRWF